MYMDFEYRQIGTDERTRHHDEVRDEGYEWCPECGETLVWQLPKPCREQASVGGLPIVTGDCPPLTRDQLVTTAPPAY